MRPEPLQNFTLQRNGKETRQQCIKNKHLSDYIYSIATLQQKVGVMSIKTEQFLKLYKIK